MAVVPSELRGDIDLANADAFRSHLYETIARSSVPAVHVDLAAVTFMDSTGYHALVAANRYAIHNDRILVIRNLPEHCAKMLRLCDFRNELLLENDSRTSN